MTSSQKACHWRARLSFSFLLVLFCFSHALAQSNPPIPPGEVRIHYFRPDGNYGGWALYTWNASTENAVWCQNEVAITGTDSFGLYFDVTVNPWMRMVVVVHEHED
jgi:pullulanase